MEGRSNGRPPNGPIVVVPAAGEQGHRVAGMPVGERLARAVNLANRRLEERTGGQPAGRVFVAGDAVIGEETLLSLCREAQANVVVAGSSPERPAVAVALPPDVDCRPRDADELGELARQLLESGVARWWPAGEFCMRVRSAREAREASARLLATMWQDTDGLLARYFDRSISTRISPWLVRWGVSPNAITMAATAIGLWGAVWLASPGTSRSVVGAALVVLSTILDGCDGEVARLTLTASPSGRRLDLLGDNAVNAAVFAALGVGAVRAGKAPAWVAWTALAGMAVAASVGLWFARWLERAGVGDRARALYERASSRDFVYLILVLSLIDRLHWFVWLAAPGTFAFAAALLVLRFFFSEQLARQWLASSEPAGDRDALGR